MARFQNQLNSETVTSTFTDAQVADSSIAEGSIYWNSDRDAMFIFVDANIGHVQIAMTQEYHFSLVLGTALNLNNVAVSNVLTYDAPAGLDWVVGQRIVFQHDQNNRLVGTVTAYDADAGGISFEVDSKTGTGTFAQWSGSFIGDAAIDGRIVVPIIGVFNNFDDLDGNTAITPVTGSIAYVRNRQGVGFGTPGWLGGTYYPPGFYMYGATTDPDNNSRWVFTKEAIVDSVNTALGRLVPEGGTLGQILRRTATGYEWATANVTGTPAGFGAFTASAVSPIDATTLGTPTVSTSGPDTALVVALGIPTGLTGATGGKGDAGNTITVSQATNANNNGSDVTFTSSDTTVSDVVVNLLNGAAGTTGDDGDSVSAVVATNTATEYTLTITSTPGDGSATTSFTTPNLRGTDGGDGDDGGLTQVTVLSTTAATDNEVVFLTVTDKTNVVGLYFRTTGQTAWTIVGSGDDGLTEEEVDARIQDNAVTIYDSSTIYQLGDVVLASAGEYRSRQNDNTDALTDTTAWVLISANIDANILNNLNSNTTHRGQTNNPHSVTATQVGLGNVDNTADEDKPVSTATQDALDLKLNTTDLDASVDTALGITTSGNQQQFLGQDGVFRGVSISGVTPDLSSVTTNDINEGTTNLYYTATRVNALIQAGTITEYSSTVNYTVGQHVLVSTGTNGGIYEALQSSNNSPVTDTSSWVKRTAFITDPQVAQITTNASNLNTHASSTANPHEVTANQAGVGFKATTFTALLADTNNIKAPGTIAAVVEAVLFNRNTALPRSSAVEANVNSIPFTYIATNNNGSYSLAFPQQPVAVPLKVGDVASFFVIPDGSGLTVGHHTALVQGQQITAANISFGGSSDPIAATLPLTSAQFAAIKATDGVESQVFQGGEALGIPNSQIFLFEASTVPTHTISTFYVYKGNTQVTTATAANDWLDSDIATDIAGISDVQSAQLLAAPKQFNPLETYALGDQIFYNDKVYAAIVGLTPAPFNILNWQVLGTGSTGTSLTTTQELILTNTVLPFAQTSSYVIGDPIIRNGDLLIATVNKTSGTAFIAANWAPASAQNLRTIVELHEVRPTEGPLTVIFTLGTETSFGYTSPSADFQLHPTDYDLITVDGTALTVEIAVTARAHNGVVTIASAIPGLTAGTHALTFQKRTEESFVEVTAAVTEVDGDIHFLGNRFLAPNIPTTDPAVANVLWRDNGVPVFSGTRAPVPSTEAFSLTHDVTETETFRISLDGFRRSNEFNADADLILDLAENLGNRLLAFLAGTAAGTDGNYGETTGATVDRTTGTIDIDNTNLLTLFVNVAGNIIHLDGKEVSIDSSTDPDLFHNIRISGIDPLVDRNVPQRGSGGEVFFVRSELEIDILTGHSTIESSDESITFDIAKHNIDLTVTNPAVITSGTVATSQATSGNGSATISNGALGIVFPPSGTGGGVGTNALTANAVNLITYTGSAAPLTANAVTPYNFIEVTEDQLAVIVADTNLIDTTAFYIVLPSATTQATPPPTQPPITPPAPTEPEPAAKSAFTPGFNSDVTVTTVGGEVTLGTITTTVGIVFVAPGSTSNNEPTIQVPVVDDDGATIPRPPVASTGVYTVNGVAPANSQAVITTAGEITLVEDGLSISWSDLGTSTIAINITYNNT